MALAAYYETGPEADPVEARYYRLLRDADVARSLSPSELSELAGMRGDFVDGSASGRLIDAAVAPRPLSAPDLGRLPHAHLHAHHARVGAVLRRLDDTRLDDRVLTIARMEPPGPQDPQEYLSAWQHLKTSFF